MSLALQILPQPEDQCLDFSLAYKITATVCATSGFNFNESRLTNIAILFDAFIREGETVISSMIHAIDLEISLRGNPIKPRLLAKPEPQQAFGMQRLPHDEETEILILAEAAGVPLSILACKMTRQTGEGQTDRRPDLEWENRDGQIIIVGVRPRKMRISYDLMLCQYCGNLEPSDRCPAKLRALRERLLELSDPTDSERMLTD
jgi:hypothetical protein